MTSTPQASTAKVFPPPIMVPAWASASIPLALNEMYEKNLLKKVHKIILVGFGGGLTYGAVLIEL